MLNKHSLALRDSEEMTELAAEEVHEYSKYLLENNKSLKGNKDLAEEVARDALRQ
jgi:hypothetical protein